ncbi:hypothetical protein NDU88_006780 [Pleurodeles waltl]|uniref:Uncharacterized protein n=1 Tax=Pleurodeles waltl TaxID=8319 RepID=A0AAV7NSX0_PLEWA|nr:hypothetical protein NDU88_006780 [Pleurodeles waltl]
MCPKVTQCIQPGDTGKAHSCRKSQLMARSLQQSNQESTAGPEHNSPRRQEHAAKKLLGVDEELCCVSREEWFSCRHHDVVKGSRDDGVF